MRTPTLRNSCKGDCSMATNRIRTALDHTPGQRFDLYERRLGEYQVILPILHEDGDMVEIFLQELPDQEGYIRVCDFGHALMRLSYNFDVNTSSRQRILASILFNCGVMNEGGNLNLVTPMNQLYAGILQLAGCVQKVCNMRYWSRETVRSSFYEDLRTHMETELVLFSPLADQSPIEDFPVAVDWTLERNQRHLYVFGVLGNDKAKNVAIALLEFQKYSLPFIGIVVHEDMEELGRRERVYLTRNADKQYPTLGDFVETGARDIDRLANVPG